MRVLPPVPFNARIANVATWLPTGGGVSRQAPVFVPKGQMVVFSSWGSHQSLRTYGPDARQFRPERWENIKADGFIPFIMGPRACLGRKCFESAVCLTPTNRGTQSIMRHCRHRML